MLASNLVPFFSYSFILFSSCLLIFNYLVLQGLTGIQRSFISLFLHFSRLELSIIQPERLSFMCDSVSERLFMAHTTDVLPLSKNHPIERVRKKTSLGLENLGE